MTAEERSQKAFEESSFFDGPDGGWDSGEGTSATGKLGLVPKAARDPRTRTLRRAKKSSPIPKILIALLVVAVVGVGGWWWVNRDVEADEVVADGLTFAGVDDPCSLVDSAPLDGVVDTADPEMTSTAQERARGWEQKCVLSYGDAESSVANLEFDATVFESDAKARVNFDLGTSAVLDMASWTEAEAPALGTEAFAVARAAEGEGTGNYQLHIQDDNVYLVIRLALTGSDLDAAGLGTLTSTLTESYLGNWHDAQ